MNNADDDMMMDGEDIPLLRRDPSSSVSMLRRGGGEGGQQFPESPRTIFDIEDPAEGAAAVQDVWKVDRLFHANFLLDNAVPRKLLDICATRTERKFMHMWYSTATCDPKVFKGSGVTPVGQMHYDPPRRTVLTEGPDLRQSQARSITINIRIRPATVSMLAYITTLVSRPWKIRTIYRDLSPLSLRPAFFYRLSFQCIRSEQDLVWKDVLVEANSP
ncbi:hypothetical protein CVT25_007337 [Psilocybe cyanescens]|uniref:Chitin synthase N-terminal domain-containing protein n=1 Tax=Psilocybe cyanescens TaxID=93625 RepID=A0A409XJE6_PSICY|nr:hypothetical protein CVT25_007337 [Psilocybe cyanescens]